jgi:RepB DNA-primase from phage plasmid
MGESGAERAEVLVMIDAFTSVGAISFDLTWTNAAGEEQAFRRNCLAPYLYRTLSALLQDAERLRNNVIVRPRADAAVTLVQLDDLNAGKLARVAAAAFLILETSPGNYQAWAAMQSSEDKDFVRRFKKGVGADATASGATRVAGSLNFKAKYAPHFPRVAIRAAHLGRMTTAAELERLGLVAAPEVPAQPLRMISAPARVSSAATRKWPSYERCLDGAPLDSEEAGPDRSRADFVWCMTAITWGWSVQDAAARLMEESSKAQANGKAYAELTARNAALAVERRRRPPKEHRLA